MVGRPYYMQDILLHFIIHRTRAHQRGGMNLKAPRVALVPSRPRGTKSHKIYRIHAHAQNQGESLNGITKKKKQG